MELQLFISGGIFNIYYFLLCSLILQIKQQRFLNLSVLLNIVDC